MLGTAKHRVSMETVDTVLTYVLPSLQRSLNEAHVDSMVEDQVGEFTRNGCFSLLQSITVARLDGRFYILDGQHRVRAFDRLVNALRLPLRGVLIPVVQYSVASAAELASYYNRINQHVPIHPLELRDAWASFARPFHEWFKTTYGAYVKSRGSRGTGTASSSAAVAATATDPAGPAGSAGPVICQTRCPHFDDTQLKTELLARLDSMNAACGGDPRRLCALVAAFNDRMCEIGRSPQQSAALPDAVRKRFSDCSAKAQRCGVPPCFLGVFRRFEWLDVCCFCAQSGQTGQVDAEVCWALLVGGAEGSGAAGRKRPRRAVPFAVREAVWSKLNAPSSTAGACYTCGGALRFQDMECGHVVPHALGGVDDLSNLMPVCRACNSDMGIQNLEAYRRRIADMRGEGRAMQE